MARFERSRERKKGPRDSYSKRDRGERESFEERPKRRRDSGRDFNRSRRDRRDVQMTKVICSSCGAECEVPFKPTSSKPVYCSNCFSKKGKSRSRSSNPSNRDLDVINEKLNKIMKALKIE